MGLTQQLIAWVSSGNPHVAPDNTLRTNGWAGGDQPAQSFLNWLLADVLTDALDTFVRPIRGTYVQTVLLSQWLIYSHWSAPGGASFAQPVWEYNTGTPASGMLSVTPHQMLPQANATGAFNQANPKRDYVGQHLRLPYGARTVQSVEVRIQPVTASRAALPSQMPRVTVVIVDKDRSEVFRQVQTDASANVGLYEANHGITVAVNHAINPSLQQLFVMVEGEDDSLSGGGPNYRAGLEVWSAVVTYQYNLASDVINGTPL